MTNYRIGNYRLRFLYSTNGCHFFKYLFLFFFKFFESFHVWLQFHWNSRLYNTFRRSVARSTEARLPKEHRKQSSTDRGQCSGGRPSRFLSSAGPYTLTETGFTDAFVASTSSVFQLHLWRCQARWRSLVRKLVATYQLELARGVLAQMRVFAEISI